MARKELWIGLSGKDRHEDDDGRVSGGISPNSVYSVYSQRKEVKPHRLARGHLAEKWRDEQFEPQPDSSPCPGRRSGFRGLVRFPKPGAEPVSPSPASVSTESQRRGGLSEWEAPRVPC